MKSITPEILRELARYLDEFPSALPTANDQEFWRLLIQQLPRRMYSKDRIEEFARELQSASGSPSLSLLYDLRAKGVTLEHFIKCLRDIRCYKALNVFMTTSKNVCIINSLCYC